jgi:hypothetical protein
MERQLEEAKMSKQNSITFEIIVPSLFIFF